LVTAPASVSSFGVDEFNELYITSFNGRIYKTFLSIGLFN
jgi:hypothetical protein